MSNLATVFAQINEATNSEVALLFVKVRAELQKRGMAQPPLTQEEINIQKEMAQGKTQFKGIEKL